MNSVLMTKVKIAEDLTDQMLKETPGWKSLEAARSQLEVLKDRQPLDRNSLESINLGVLAVREFDERSPEYSDLLIEIQGLVKEELGELTN